MTRLKLKNVVKPKTSKRTSELDAAPSGQKILGIAKIQKIHAENSLSSQSLTKIKLF